MKWPRGKYNGWRIIGARCNVSIYWHPAWWLLRARWNFGEPLLWLGPLRLWFYVEYDPCQRQP